MTSPDRRFARIGIVAGLDSELAAFRPDLARVAAADLPIAASAVEHDGRMVFLACGGIGKVAAATVATVLAARCAVDLLLVIGTAGRIGPVPGGACRITHAYQGDYGARRSDGLVPYTAGSWPMGPPTLAPFAAYDLPGPALPDVGIVSGDVFVECAAHSAWLHDRFGAGLVDMETAAVAQTAALLGLPWAAIKATTDTADEDSAGAFLTHLATAARAAGIAAEQAIAALP